MSKKLSTEHVGEIFIFLEILGWATFPLLVNASGSFLPPLIFTGFSIFTAGILILVILIFLKKTKDLFNRQAFVYVAASSLFLLVFFAILTLAGQKTNEGNMAILSQSEVLFTCFFFGFLGLEKINKTRMIGVFFVLIGSCFILFQNFTGQLNIWDFVIFFIGLLAPFANFFQKKSVRIIAPKVHLCLRSLLMGLVLIIIGLVFEEIPRENLFSKKGLFLILVNGIIAFGISKVLFLEAIKRIDVSKAIAIGSFYPAVTLLLSLLIFHKIPSLAQIIGFIMSFVGVWFLTRKNIINKPISTKRYHLFKKWYL